MWYNEQDPSDPARGIRPVWMVEPNSMITSPVPGTRLDGPRVRVHGWAWSADSVTDVGISADGGRNWVVADVKPRTDFSWQHFETVLELPNGKHQLVARATSLSEEQQPLFGRRNHVHTVAIEVSDRLAATEPREVVHGAEATRRYVTTQYFMGNPT